MGFYKKIKRFLRSWEYLDLNINSSTLLMGYQGKDLIKFFDIQSENFICSSTKRPFNNKLIIRSLLIFLKTLFLRPYLFLKVLRWVHTIYFICAYIEKKNIINIVSFTDYNLVPFYIKKILGKKIKTFCLQNSRRENRSNHFNFDEYFLLTPLRKDEVKHSNNCKLNQFGSLRMCLSINQNNMWKTIKDLPSQNENKTEFLLISSLAPDFLEFLDKHFSDKIQEENFKNNIDELVEKFINQKNNFREIRFINFLLLFYNLNNYVNKKKDKLIILNRADPNSEYFQREKKFYYNFKNVELKKLNKINKYNFILSDKQRIVVSDISTLSRECLAINMKCLFFNKYINYTGEYWTSAESIFYSKKENNEKFDLRLDKIKLLSKDSYMNEKNKINNTSIVISPDRDNFDYFFKKTNLKLNKLHNEI